MTLRKPTLIGLVLGLMFSLSACSRTEAPAATEISVTELSNLTQNDTSLLLIDVRGVAEYEAVHALPVKRLITYTEIADSAANLPADKDAPIYLICRTGRRSAIAARTLLGLGYRNVYNVAGGTSAWVAAKLPSESGRGILPPAQP